MPLRHAGQYFDSEVGLFYNYFRDYNPKTGRYVESDPIGLKGGMNTYGYVEGNALGAVDPDGLQAALCVQYRFGCGGADFTKLGGGWGAGGGGLGLGAAANSGLNPADASDNAPAKAKEKNCPDNQCNPPAGVPFNKVTHYERHGRNPDISVGSHGCMAKTGSPVHWHYDVNDQLPDGSCKTRYHVLGGCGVAPK